MLLATTLALLSAALHAAWNLRIKVSGQRSSAVGAQFACGALFTAPLFLIAGPPGEGVLFLLAISTAIHVFYLVALIRSYETGDFSMAYPVARGGGALLAALGGVALLDDQLNEVAAIAIVVVGIGLFSLLRPSTPLHALGWGALTAALIATYTLIDSAAARDAGGLEYGAAITVATGVSFNLFLLATGRGKATLYALRSSPLAHLLVGACSSGAYVLVLVAVNYAPVGYVATLRESSVVFGAIAAGWILHERLARPRVASSVVIAAGMVLLIAARP